MAAENFIHDLSEYLTAGNLSDLTLIFGEKNWQIHKALACCHSRWFQKAITIGFEESESGVITLKDDLEFANAIDCMVSYFYKADYNVSLYDTSGPLLHAQVAIIADKYDCASLYKLAKTLFANTVNTVKSDDWVAVAAVIYDHTTTDLPAHKEFRSLIVAAATNRPGVLKSILQLESTAELLRSTVDLAIDLLLSEPYMSKLEEVTKYNFTCENCQYTHVGLCSCTFMASRDRFLYGTCPQCGKQSGATSQRHAYRVGLIM